MPVCAPIFTVVRRSAHAVSLGSGAFPNVTTLNVSDPGLIAALSYHVVAGSYADETANFPNTTIGRTYLNASSLVMLEGNKSQVLAWSHYGSDNTTHIMNQK
jgi:hypothetical protein